VDGVVLEFVCVFLAGILAGEEFVVRYGVHTAIAVLDERSQIQARQALIRRLRVLVPAILGPAVVSAVATLVVAGSGPGSGFRWAGALALLAFVLITFIGTVPINQRVGTWRADAPPGDWKKVVRRWAWLDVFRSSAAILAFALFTAAAAA
jgi:uncharacterized membrane protein